jgi:hypothetical protein
MIKTVLLKIKKGKEDIWKEWCKKIQNQLYDEAVESLKEEKVKQEIVIKFELQNSTYSIAFMDGDCLPANPNREINKMHKQMKAECIESVSDAELLYNVKADN